MRGSGRQSQLDLSCSNNEECCMITNATGLVPDIRGMHGPSTTYEEFVQKVPQLLDVRENGGILSRSGVVERIVPSEGGLGPASLVFCGRAQQERDATGIHDHHVRSRCGFDRKRFVRRRQVSDVYPLRSGAARSWFGPSRRATTSHTTT
jgi:hypothetical protein